MRKQPVIFEDQHHVDPPSPWVYVDGNHMYKVEGINKNKSGTELAMSSVSTIAGLASGFSSDAAKRWASKLALAEQDADAHARASAAYAEIGTIHHRHISGLALSDKDEAQYLETWAQPWGLNYDMFVGWSSWMKEHGVVFERDFIATEMYVYSKTLKYAGQLDAIIQFEGTPTIFDWKTATKGGASIKDSAHAVQVGGYYLALQEMLAEHGGYPFELPTQAFIGYTFRDAPKEVQLEKVDIKSAIEVFEHAQKIHAGKARGGLYVTKPDAGW